MRRRRQLLLAAVLVAGLAVPAAAIHTPQTLLSGSLTDVEGTVVAISDDGSRVAYQVDDSGDRRIHTSSLDGATPAPVQVSTARLIDPKDLRWTADGSTLLYRSRTTPTGPVRLYAADGDRAGTQRQLSGTAGAFIDVTSFELSPDGTRVVYRAQDASGDSRLFVSATSGGSATQLSPEPATGAGPRARFRITPDSEHVVYVDVLDAVAGAQLIARPLDRSRAAVALSSSDATAKDVSGTTIAFGAGRRVLFTGDLDTVGVDGVHSARWDATDASTRTRVSGPDDGSGGITGLTVTGDGTWVVWSGSSTTPDVGVFRATPTGGDRIRLDTPDGDSEVESTLPDLPRITPDGASVVYVRRDEGADVRNVHLAPLATTGGQRRLTELSVGAAITGLQLGGDRGAVLTDSADLGTLDLVGFDLTAPARAVRLSDVVPEQDIGPFVVAADGTRVIYVREIDGRRQVRSTSFAAGEPDQVVSVAATTDPALDVDPSVLLGAPDSSFVVYAGDLRTDGSDDLYASGIAQQPPLEVGQLMVTDADTTTADLAWSRPPYGGQLTGHRFTVTTTDGRPDIVLEPGADATTVRLRDLPPDTAHTVRVATVNDAGVSDGVVTTFTTAAPDPVVEPTPVRPPAPRGVVRLGGESRFATAARVALDRFDPDDVGVVYLATGVNFPDALAGGPLAARVGAPVLLVTPTALPDTTRDALAILAPDAVVALGGEVAVATDVLRAAGAAAGEDTTTLRLAGANRYATAAAIADALVAAGGDTTTAYLAIGTNFPDAVAAGPATGGAPILLTDGTALPDATRQWLDTNRPETIVAVGGTAVLPDAVLSAAATAAGGASTDRLAGDDRFATATAIAATVGDTDTAYVAVGTNFPDALAGGPAAASELGPIVLVDGGDVLPSDTRVYLDDLPDLRRVVILGGTAVVSPGIEDELRSLLD